MKFLIQKENNNYSIDNHLLSNLIDGNKWIYEKRDWSFSDFFDTNKKLLTTKNLPDFKDYIPLGDIAFTETFFKIFYNIENENPIEIPPVLRTYEFLKRDYSIVSIKDIPLKGYYFIKDVSRLKVFSYTGMIEHFLYDKNFYNSESIISSQTDETYNLVKSLCLDNTHLYQVSEVINILSEYRVFVIDNKIYSINNYDGDVTLFPDIKLIQKAINIWSIQKDCPNSYSMDVAITPKGTVILECHILFSTGIYNTVLGNNFLYGYRDAKDYLINFNTPITKCNIKN